MEKQINEKIIEIVHQVNNMIPVVWDDLYINFEVSDSLSGEVYFFFKYQGVYHYFYYIPREFGVSEKVFFDKYNKLFTKVQELKKVFIANHLQGWSGGMIYVSEENKLSLEFDYTPWLESEYGPSERTNFFCYKYLGFEPRDEKELERFKAMEAFQQEHNGK